MNQTVKQIILNNVDFVGFVPVKTYIERRSSLQINDGFDQYDKIMPFQTIAVLGLAYPKQEVTYKGKGYGLLSRYSYGTDYHIVFRKKIRTIDTALQKHNINTFGSVDVSPVDERFAAALTSQGYIGKNQAFIQKDYGPYVYLATILLDIDVQDERYLIDDCGDCRQCIDACPSGALDYGFEREKCLSYVTQKKEVLTDTEIPLLKTMVYGCDICYKVCPKSTGIDAHLHPEFEPSGIENVDLINLLQRSNKVYYQDYDSNASSWRGPTVIRRNALALLYNHNMTEAIPDIEASIKIYQAPWYQDTAKKILRLFKEKNA